NSTADASHAGDWHGIRVINGGELYVSGLNLSGAVNAIEYRQNGNITRNPVISFSNLEELTGDGIILEAQGQSNITIDIDRNDIGSVNGRGINIQSTGAGTVVTGDIRDNSVYSAGLNPIYLYVDNHAKHTLSILQNSFSDSGSSSVGSEDGSGIFIHHNLAHTDGLSSYHIEGNSISWNSQNGIHLDLNESDVDLTLLQNQLYDNNGYGVYSNSTSRALNAQLLNNTISYSDVDGIYFESGNSSTTIQVELAFNNIHHNTANGVGLNGVSDYTVFYNTIHDNTGVGIQLSSLNAGSVNFNNLYTNDTINGIALQNNGSTDVDARYNWWGDTINSEINTGANPKNLTGIYDSYDDLSKGVVDYTNWLTVMESEPLSSDRISRIITPSEGETVTTPTFTIDGLAKGTSLDRVEVSTDNGASWQVATGIENWSFEWTITEGNGVYTILSRAVNTNNFSETPTTGRTVTVDIVVPVEVTLDAIPTTTQTSPVTLSGTKSADSAIYIDGALVVPLDSTTAWSYDHALNEGLNTFTIESRNSSGNTSTPIEASIILDTVAPVISGAVPGNNSYVSTRPSTLVYSLQEDSSGLDSAAIIASAAVERSSGTSVSGTWSVNGSNQLIFTPGALLTEDTYTTTATITDLAGNATGLSSTFTYDATPPAAPTIDPVSSPTTANSQLLQGQKQPDTSIWINDSEMIPIDTSTAWSYEVSLVSGSNSFTVYSKDLANNQSTSATVQITYDDLSPQPVDALTVNALGIGTVAELRWVGYDETVDGDIAGYRVYIDTNSFSDVTSMTPAASVPAGIKTYNFTGLTRGQTYFFAVVAYDLNGSANNSVTPVSATTTS
ncbi:MAG: right-handed parallel beta-helix repeat-containing protein, partial [Desulfobacterales bacterium]|nr:right-handed parallel beta-helix repeat-containing protein [Desulfobacterales bacterium]